MIINLICALVDNHIPQDDIFDYHPRRECNIYIISSVATATRILPRAIAAGDIIKYQGGHMMHNADARTVRSRQRRSTAMVDMRHDLVAFNSR